MAHRIFIAYLVKPADLVNKFLPMLNHEANLTA